MENHGGEKQETRLASFVVERLLEWFRSEVTNIWDRRSSFGYEQFSAFGHSCSTDVTLNCSRVLFPESPAFRLKSLPPTQLLSAEAKRSWYLLISISNPSEILHTHTHTKWLPPKYYVLFVLHMTEWSFVNTKWMVSLLWINSLISSHWIKRKKFKPSPWTTKPCIIQSLPNSLTSSHDSFHLHAFWMTWPHLGLRTCQAFLHLSLWAFAVLELRMLLPGSSLSPFHHISAEMSCSNRQLLLSLPH